MQVAEQAYPLLQRRPPANRMREHRNNRGGRRNNGRTAWQRIFDYLASRGTRTLPHLTLGPGIAQYLKGAVGLLAARMKEEEKASEHRQRKREAEEADNVEVAPGVTVASLRRFRAALIGLTQGLPKRPRLCL